MARTPYFGFSVGGSDVTENVMNAGLLAMTVVDGVGRSADKLTIVVDDVDGQIIPPTKGVKLQAFGGYVDQYVDFGTFIVDQISYDGWPQKVTISAQSVGAKEAAKAREPKGFPKSDYASLGDIAEEVAGEIGLELEIASDLASKVNAGEARGEEDALQFLQRIFIKHDGAVTVKSGRLIVVKRGDGKSASGSPMGVLLVAVGVNLLSYTANEEDKPQHSSVKATAYNRQKNEVEEAVAETGLEGPEMLLREPFSTLDDAQAAVESRSRELRRAVKSGTFKTEGIPQAAAEQLVQVSGARPIVDGLYRAKTVTHSFSGTTFYNTNLECEAPS